ncbi:MAG: Holliday junction resolvase RuvX [Alphaproteobacteria bacterium]|nr:Holliday junction resolvase RuvX [Alphaproteobacteria bacterium]
MIDIKELCLESLKGRGRVLCIDYGDKRVGLAISDIFWTIASPMDVLESHGIYKKLIPIIKNNSVNLIIVGLPKSLSGGSAGQQLEKVQKFVCKLEELLAEQNIDVKMSFWDERLSTVAANRFLEEGNISRSNRRSIIDKVAASFILRGFLDYVLVNF